MRSINNEKKNKEGKARMKHFYPSVVIVTDNRECIHRLKVKVEGEVDITVANIKLVAYNEY